MVAEGYRWSIILIKNNTADMSLKGTCLFINLLLLFNTSSMCQSILTDSTKKVEVPENEVKLLPTEQAYNVPGGRTFIYTKPRPFSFFTNVPHDAAGIVRTTFKRENIKPLFTIGGATLLLMLVDQPIADGVHRFSKQIHFQSQEEYNDVINVKLGKTNVSLLKAPKNLNTALYQ